MADAVARAHMVTPTRVTAGRDKRGNSCLRTLLVLIVGMCVGASILGVGISYGRGDLTGEATGEATPKVEAAIPASVTIDADANADSPTVCNRSRPPPPSPDAGRLRWCDLAPPLRPPP